MNNCNQFFHKQPYRIIAIKFPIFYLDEVGHINDGVVEATLQHTSDSTTEPCNVHKFVGILDAVA